MMSGKNFLKSHILSWQRKMYSDREDVTSSGKAFQVFGSVTGKARLPMVDRLTGGTRRLLAPVERSDRLPGTLRTGTSGPRYVGGALPWKLSHYQQCQHYSVQTRTVTTVYTGHPSHWTRLTLCRYISTSQLMLLLIPLLLLLLLLWQQCTQVLCLSCQDFH